MLRVKERGQRSVEERRRKSCGGERNKVSKREKERMDVHCVGRCVFSFEHPHAHGIRWLTPRYPWLLESLTSRGQL